MFTKVKAASVVVILAGLAGVIDALSSIDFTQFGPFGLAIGAFVTAAVAYVKREVTYYGGSK